MRSIDSQWRRVNPIENLKVSLIENPRVSRGSQKLCHVKEVLNAIRSPF